MLVVVRDWSFDWFDRAFLKAICNKSEEEFRDDDTAAALDTWCPGDELSTSEVEVLEELD